MGIGRPPMWDDPAAFEKKVDEYFDTEKTPTWSGLALYLGFESRKSLHDYGQKEGFSYPVKKALIRIEAIYEQRMVQGQAAGPIFALKNFGWTDKQEIVQDATIKDERIDVSKLTTEQRDQLAAIQLQLRRRESQE